MSDNKQGDIALLDSCLYSLCIRTNVKHAYNSKISYEKGLLKNKNSLVVILKFFRANLNYFDSDSGFKFEIINI